MIWNKYVLLTLITFLIANVIVWYQLNGQLVWGFWITSRGIILSLLMGIPVTGLFWLATKWGYLGFGNLWAVRFMGFATSMLIFPCMTYFYLNETFITIMLSIIIMILQLL